MRVAVSRACRVAPGDTVILEAKLPPATKLGRLFIFGSTGGSFSPYAPGAEHAARLDKPQMLAPLALRLTEQIPFRIVKVPVDIDGWLAVYQEVDLQKDPRVKVKLDCQIDPHMGWRQRLRRKLLRISCWRKPAPLS